jgi:hypothetical protein
MGDCARRDGRTLEGDTQRAEASKMKRSGRNRSLETAPLQCALFCLRLLRRRLRARVRQLLVEFTGSNGGDDRVDD